MISLDLPEPSAAEKQHSQRLTDHIQQRIREADGWLSFEQYMQLALYAPGLGYYSGGLQKFGEQGDFITAPEVGSLFARSLARPLAQLLEDIPQGQIMEFGAGSGKLAADLLAALDSAGQLPRRYLIIELSAELRQRQKQTLQQRVPALLPRVEWLDSLPQSPIDGVIIANEVMDAMPVRRFKKAGDRVMELGVEWQQGALRLAYREADQVLRQQVQALPIGGEGVYCSEINSHIAPWIASLADCIRQGGIYLIDYGYPRTEYYSPERDMGTFIGYYQHRSLDAPLWYPGLQDLTAFVDFSSVAEAAQARGLDVDGYTSQGNFLLNCGLGTIVEQMDFVSEIDHLKIVQQMKTLTLPGEMGERFKVMGLSKGLEKNIPGFEQRDMRYSL